MFKECSSSVKTPACGTMKWRWLILAKRQQYCNKLLFKRASFCRHLRRLMSNSFCQGHTLPQFKRNGGSRTAWALFMNFKWSKVARPSLQKHEFSREFKYSSNVASISLWLFTPLNMWKFPNIYTSGSQFANLISQPNQVPRGLNL